MAWTAPEPDDHIPNRFADQVVIVTGAASGFGAATARRFHAEGASVVVADLDGAGAARMADELGERASSLRVDVSRSDDMEAMVAHAVDRFGGLDVLVNNAGIIHAKTPIEDLDVDTLDRVVSVNLRGAFLGIKHATPAMRARGRGAIVNMASVGALLPRRQTSLYSATKSAVITLTKSAALDLSPEIRVNAVCPSAADTPFLAGGAGGGGEKLEAYRRQMAADAARSMPLGRLATPTDVAAGVTFLASDDAAFITGIALTIDGGRSAGDTTGRVGVTESAQS